MLSFISELLSSAAGQTMLHISMGEDMHLVTPPAGPASGGGLEGRSGETLEEGDVSQESCNPVAATVPCAITF